LYESLSFAIVLHGKVHPEKYSNIDFHHEEKTMTRYTTTGIVMLITALFLSPACFGADNLIARTATTEYTILSGYGITHRGFGATRTQVQTFDTIGRFGYFLSDDIGSGAREARPR
jgi:hypothetical protein